MNARNDGRYLQAALHRPALRPWALPRWALPSAALILAAALLASCQRWPTEERVLSVDVPTFLFNAVDHADPALRGAGIDLVQLSVVCKEGFGSLPFSASLAAADIVPGADWTRLSLSVRGELSSLEATGSLGGSEVCWALADEVEEADIERYGGWLGFPALLAFKLDWEAGTEEAGILRILPCPRPGALLAWDSGPSAGGNTDIGAGLLSLQVAVQLSVLEDDSTGDISYDLWYALADEDPSAYSTADFSNTYLAHPWDPWWTWAQAAGGEGKTIGLTHYTLTRLSGPHVAGQADGSGHYAVMMDFSAVEGAAAGKWVLVCPVLTRSGLSVPARTLSIELR